MKELDVGAGRPGGRTPATLTTSRPDVARWAFAHRLAFGEDVTTAYKITHEKIIKYHRWSPAQVRRNAWQLMKSKRVEKLVAVLQEEVRAFYRVDPADWIAKAVEIRETAVAKKDFRAAIRAHEIIGQVCGFFVQKLEINDRRRSEAEIVQRLQALISAHPDIGKMLFPDGLTALKLGVQYGHDEILDVQARGVGAAQGPGNDPLPAHDAAAGVERSDALHGVRVAPGGETPGQAQAVNGVAGSAGCDQTHTG